MRTRGTFLARAAWPLLVAGALAGWGGTTPAGAADAGTTTQVSISGTVSGAPESVAFSGTASINSRLAPDPDFGNHKVVLIVDLRSVSGVGAATQTKYVISGPDIMHRHLGAADMVNITFPFAPAGSTGVGDARSGLASFALSFDVNTGAVTAATAAVGTPSP
jgi:hypothetical protein